MSASVSKSDDNAVTLGHNDANRSSSAIVAEGVLAGVIAAAMVAVVFLVIDMASGHTLRTPTQLGGMLLTLIGSAPAAPGDIATPLALYTLFHFIAFIVVGIIVASIVQVTMRQPSAVLLFVIVFFAFEVVFTGFVAFLDATSTSGITHYQVAIGNLVATIAMAVFFTARHPRLRKLGRALNAEE